MKKLTARLLSFVVVLCLLLTAGATSALAADTTVSVDGIRNYTQAYAVLEIVNAQRAANGAAPLTMSEELLRTAMLRSEEQAVYYSHTRPDGTSCFTAFPQGGAVGENIAANYSSAETVMNAWMNSEGHRENILRTNYTTIGIGCFEHNGVKYWTQCFSSATKPAYAAPENVETTAEVNIGSIVYSFQVSGPTAMNAGETASLEVTQANPGFTWATTVLNPAGLEWVSENPTVLAVKDGVLEAVSAGTATVSATVGVNTLSHTVTVSGTAVHTHTLQHIEAKDATYLEAGVMEHWTCSVCARCFTDSRGVTEIAAEDLVIPKLICTEHSWDEGTVTKTPTATETGEKTFTCTRCGAQRTEELPIDTTVTMMHSGSLTTAKPNEQALRDKWNTITSATEFFAVQPSVTAPYVAGRLTDELYTSGITYLNFIRFAANLPAVEHNIAYSDGAQHGAVLMAANNVLSHNPTQPADMPDDFYETGRAATSSSNISMRYGYVNYNPLQSSLQGCMNDSGTNNLAGVGHRRWLLNPILSEVGFGYAKSTAGADFIDTHVFDRRGPDVDYDFISWPASDSFPNNVFPAEAPWSVTLNPIKYASPDLSTVTVSLTRVSDGVTWYFDAATGGPTTSAEPYLTVNNNGYGVSNCIIFSPGSTAIGSYYGTYIVSIGGITLRDGTETAINYQVDFFNIDECLHVTVNDEAVEPTCETTGLTAGAHCSQCGKVFTAQTVIPALGHKYDEGTVTKAATCTEEGTKIFVCENDPLHTKTETLPVIDHADEDGDLNCDLCGLFLCEHENTEVLPAKEATCSEEGLTEGSKCADCGTVLVEQTAIPLKEHEETPDDEILPTCEEDGISEGSHCTVCGKIINAQTVLPALGHKYDEGTVTKAATCTEEGVKTFVCENDPAHSYTEAIPMTEHVYTDGVCVCGKLDPNAPTPTPVVTPTPTPVVTPTPTPVVTPTPTPVVTPTPTPVVTPTPTPVVTPTPTPVVTPTPTPVPSGQPFVDVAPDDYFFEAVQWAVEENVTSGIDVGVFAPEAGCTRAQVVTFLWRAAGEPIPRNTINPFTDVSGEDYYYRAVLWAVENGITSGVSATSFAPDTHCTRGQIAAFLYRAAGEPSVTGYNPFFDIAPTDYFFSAVLWAVQEGITNGASPTAFAPDATCTRGQIVTFLYRSSN